MKNTTFLLFLLLSVPAFAEDRWRASVLRLEHGHAAAMAYAPSAAWDIEAAVGERPFEIPITTFIPGTATALTEFRHYTAHPIDLFVTRHFPAAGRLAAFVHAGARYVELPGHEPRTIFLNGLPVTVFTGTEHRTSAQAGGGLLLRLTSRTALRAEVTRLLRSREAPADPLTRTAAGLSWRF